MAFEKVASERELEVGGTLLAELGGEPICVVRLDADTVKACHDVCSHEEYPLHEGWVGPDEIECARHGSTFDLSTGEPTCLPAVRPIPVYAARIADGAIWVDVEGQLNDAPPPRH